MKTIESILEKHGVVCSCYMCGKSIEQPEEQYDMYGEMVCQECWDYNVYQALQDCGDVEIVDINNIPEDFGLLYTKEAEYQMEMIKQYDDWRYSHLSKKEREADIKPIRNSKDNPKIGRNELCPCGSGKKYKRCCFSSCR